MGHSNLGAWRMDRSLVRQPNELFNGVDWIKLIWDGAHTIPMDPSNTTSHSRGFLALVHLKWSTLDT